MKYKEIFTSWWFYALTFIFFLFNVSNEKIIPGESLLIKYVGLFFGSLLGVLFFVSLFWLLIKGFSHILKNVTKR